MKIVKIIKKLCEHKGKIYKKTLIMRFLEDINFHSESAKIYGTIKNLDLAEKMLILSKEKEYSIEKFNYLLEQYEI
jgi:hypothetical protein